MSRDIPSEAVINRAVFLWKRALENPTYQNTRPEEPEHRSNMAPILAGMLPQNSTPEILDAFGAALKRRIRDDIATEQGLWRATYLSVDYHPDQILDDAAAEAGLKTKFPWKTTMHLRPDHLSFAVGYGAPHVYHYDLGDGRWLVAELSGRGIEALKAHILAGQPHPFTVETWP